MTKAEYTKAAFETLMDTQARAFVRNNDVPVGGSESCEECAHGAHDSGGWIGCTLDYPCFPDHDTSQNLYDAIVLEMGDDGAVWPFLAVVCPAYRTFQDAFVERRLLYSGR